MRVLLAVSVVLCLWGVGQCVYRRKSSHTTKNPSTVTVTEHVYFDLKVHHYYKKNEHMEGRFVVAVFGDLLPMTALNFISIARGYTKGKQLLSYNNTVSHRVVADFMVQFGDITKRNGLGSTSIYTDKFRDEGFFISHASSGIVSMANDQEPDTNGSQFFVTLQPARYLDSRHVAFGKVIAGMDFIQKIGNVNVDEVFHPVRMVQIVGCGIEGLLNKYTLTSQQLEMDSAEFKPEDFFEEQETADDDDE